MRTRFSVVTRIGKLIDGSNSVPSNQMTLKGAYFALSSLTV